MSGFVVSARKYRPTRFDEVVGQEHVTDTLKRAMITDKIAHAFLFCGPRGVGKTTCARILAKAINCTNPSEDREPCNECKSCVAFNDSASFNIIELDAASHNGVEHIRALVDQVNIQPQSGTYKVFIIDEVHMLSTSAFNAFLKTLEEPPPYAIFILATTEKHKILPTILSRCQIYDFKRIEADDIVTYLKGINQQEGITADEEALFVIGQKADGALRDALSIYDRLRNLDEGGMTYQSVIEALGMLDYETYFKMVDFILTEDAAGLLMTLDRALGQGYEAEEVMKGISSHVRDLMFFKHSRLEPLVKLPKALLDRYRIQASACSESLLVNALDVITDALYKGQLAPEKRTLYEISLTKIAYLNRLISGDGNITPSQEVKKKTNPVTHKSDQQEASGTDMVVQNPTVSDRVVDKNKNERIEKESAEKMKDIAASRGISELQKSKPKKQRSAKPSSIYNSLEQIATEVKREQKDRKKGRTFNNDEMQAIWSMYIDQIPAEFVREWLKEASVIIVDDFVQITVNHKRVEEAITSEFNCIIYIREAFDKPELEVNIVVDETEGDKPVNKRLITKKEKFDFLVEKNPTILELTRRFKLKFD